MTADKQGVLGRIIIRLCAMRDRFRFGGRQVSGMALFSAADAPPFEEDSFLDTEVGAFHCPKLYPKLFRRWRSAQARRIPKSISSAIRY
jgi:hypothetical protein